jgi:hypothetical protein
VPRLSIVIPVLGDSPQLDDTLLSVLENRPASCEIVVVHNRPYHDPYHLGDEVQFIQAERGATMVECLNQGLAASSAPIVHILTCGVHVCSGWADAALRHFRDPDIAAVGAVVLHRDDRRRTISAGLGYCADGTAWRLEQLNESGDVTGGEPDFFGPDTLAAFYRRCVVQSLGGLSPWAGDSLAGIDLALALRHAGFRCVLEPRCVTHVDAATTYIEPAFRRGRNVERLFWRWASRQGWVSSLGAHVALLAGQCVTGLWHPSMFAQLAGRAWGALQLIFTRRRRRAAEPALVTKPSVIAAPHFSTERLHKERRSSRVA